MHPGGARVLARAGRAINGLIATAVIVFAFNWNEAIPASTLTSRAVQVGARKAIIALPRNLLIGAWRMLLTGKVCRAAKTTMVERKRRGLQKLIRAHVQTPATLPSHPIGMTPLPTPPVAGLQSVMCRRRTAVSS